MFSDTQNRQFKTVSAIIHPDRVSAEEFGEDAHNCATQLFGIFSNTCDRQDGVLWDKLFGLIQEFGLKKGHYNGLRPALLKALELRDGKAKSQDKTKTKAKAEVKIQEDVLAAIKAKEQATGWDRRKLGAWVTLEYDLSASEVKAYLDLVFAKASESSPKGWAAQFYDRLKEGPMSKEEVIAWANGTGSNNVKANIPHYWGIAQLANAIWAKK